MVRRVPLTSERVKKLINVTLMECDCVAQHTIVAGGEQACDPHNEGSGPLPAHRSIIFDVFPRSATNRYFADMSRTVVCGTPESRAEAALSDGPGCTGRGHHESQRRGGREEDSSRHLHQV